MNSYDEKLIVMLEKLQTGDKTVFSDINSSFSPLVRSLAAKYAPPEEFEEALQCGRVSLYNAAMSYNVSQHNVSFGLYAKICISNALISNARKRKKGDMVCSLDEMNERGVFYSYAPDEFEQPDAHLIRNEELDELKRIASDHLSGYEKQVFDLYITGMSTYRISSVLGKDVKSVNNALCRITAKLKGLLK